jgi:hypothetical protein
MLCESIEATILTFMLNLSFLEGDEVVVVAEGLHEAAQLGPGGNKLVAKPGTLSVTSRASSVTRFCNPFMNRSIDVMFN